jgi:hypothetical protein
MVSTYDGKRISNVLPLQFSQGSPVFSLGPGISFKLISNKRFRRSVQSGFRGMFPGGGSGRNYLQSEIEEICSVIYDIH